MGWGHVASNQCVRQSESTNSAAGHRRHAAPPELSSPTHLVVDDTPQSRLASTKLFAPSSLLGCVAGRTDHAVAQQCATPRR